MFYLFFTNIDKLNKPVAQSLDDLETVKREHLVILYFESALYDLYKNTVVKFEKEANKMLSKKHKLLKKWRRKDGQK